MSTISLRGQHSDKHGRILRRCLLAFAAGLPLSLGSVWRHLSKAQLIRILTAAGANPNIITTDGATPVGLAVNLGLPNALTALFAAGGSPHLTVEGAPTPLQNAIIDMRPTCLALLLAAGADPEECHTSISPYVTAELKRLRPSYPPGTSGARMLQILAVAHAYDACSWRWPLPSTGDTASTNGLREGENTVGDTVGDTQGPEEEINALQTRSRPEVEAFKWRAATAQKNRVMQNAFGRLVSGRIDPHCIMNLFSSCARSDVFYCAVTRHGDGTSRR